MLGLAVAVLEYAGEWRAVSVIITCAFPMGVVGTTLSGMSGIDKSFWNHVVMMAVGTSASWKLMQVHW